MNAAGNNGETKWHEGCMPVALIIIVGIIVWGAVEIVKIFNC